MQGHHLSRLAVAKLVRIEPMKGKYLASIPVLHSPNQAAQVAPSAAKDVVVSWLGVLHTRTMVEQLTQNALKGDRSTASKFFHVHHEASWQRAALEGDGARRHRTGRWLE